MSDSKSELRKKLKQKLDNKKMLRTNKEFKNNLINENLKKNGIEDVDKFKNDIKNIQDQLKSNGIDIEKMLRNNGNDVNKILSNLTKK